VIAILLYAHFRRAAETGIVMLGTILFAPLGGIWLLYLFDFNLSVAVGVGFIALLGLAAETGVVMLVYLNGAYDRFRSQGRMNQIADLKQAIVAGSVERVRPILMTVGTTMIGLLPIMIGTETGTRVMKRIAAPMVGGLVSSTLLTLLVLPAVYLLWKGSRLGREAAARPNEMRKEKTSLLACALLLFGGAARASEFDRAMEPILAEYLKIHGALAADTTEGIEPAVQAIAKAARELEPEQVAGEHAEQYRHIPHQIAAACQKLQAAKDIEATREAFKELSKPLSTWAAVAEPAGTSVMHCSMAKASWVQRGPAVANPYYGAEMSSCGEHVAGEHMGGEHTHEAHRGAQHGGGRE
jgi:hypothetical protein